MSVFAFSCLNIGRFVLNICRVLLFSYFQIFVARSLWSARVFRKTDDSEGQTHDLFAKKKGVICAILLERIHGGRTTLATPT